MRTAYLSILLSLLVLTACRDSGLDNQSDREGWINLNLKLAVEKIQTRSGETEPAQPIFNIRILNGDQKTVKNYEDHTQIPERIWLTTGHYTVKGTSGKEVEAEFEAPYYTGEKEFDIIPEQGTDIQLPAQLASAKVGIGYTQNILNNFPERTAKVTNGTKQLTFDKNEARQGYFKVDGKTAALTWNIEFVNNDGKTYTETGKIENPKANTYYRITFDIQDEGNGIGGIRILPIIVEETVIEIEHDQDITIFPYPGINGLINEEGFPVTETQSILYNDPTTTFKIKTSGYPSIKSLVISHNIADLKTKGVPEQFNFMELGDSPKQVLRDAGISWEINPSSSTITFDFSGMVQTLSVTPESADPNLLHFTVTDLRGKTTDREVTFTVFNSDVKTQNPKAYDIWSRRIVISGTWLNTQPGTLCFEYKKAGETGWQTTQGSATLSINPATKTFTDAITGLEIGTRYQIRAVGSSAGNAITVTTDLAPQVPNMNFEGWNGTNPWPSGGEQWWDSGNGAASMAGLTLTEPSTNVPTGMSGNSAQLTSKYASTFKAFAAGNIFVGKFGKLSISPAGADMTFGKPYTGRPSALRGHYRYNSKVVDQEGSRTPSLKGKNDRFLIYVLLVNKDRYLNTTKKETLFNTDKLKRGEDDYVTVIGYGELTNEVIESDGTDNTPAVAMSDYAAFNIPIRYFRTDLKPSYIIIAATSSKYGDYLTGGEGSQLYVDEFELLFE